MRAARKTRRCRAAEENEMVAIYADGIPIKGDDGVIRPACFRPKCETCFWKDKCSNRAVGADRTADYVKTTRGNTDYDPKTGTWGPHYPIPGDWGLRE